MSNGSTTFSSNSINHAVQHMLNNRAANDGGASNSTAAGAVADSISTRQQQQQQQHPSHVYSCKSSGAGVVSSLSTIAAADTASAAHADESKEPTIVNTTLTNEPVSADKDVAGAAPDDDDNRTPVHHKYVLPGRLGLTGYLQSLLKQRSALAVGIPPLTLGLNHVSEIPLYMTFGLPWNFNHGSNVLDTYGCVPLSYCNPWNYTMMNTAKQPSTESWSESHLMFAFYNLPSNPLQLHSAVVLYSRGWRYNPANQTWYIVASVGSGDGNTDGTSRSVAGDANATAGNDAGQHGGTDQHASSGEPISEVMKFDLASWLRVETRDIHSPSDVEKNCLSQNVLLSYLPTVTA
eukprot:Lankesteria_metandrocarpae@DN3517_c0_g1_i1.p2